MSLESFKSFVRSKPNLASYVENNTMSWQKFYEIYELYGDNSSVWDKYSTSKESVITLKDMFDSIKNIDMTEVQKSITSLQKGIGYLEGLLAKDENNIPVRKSSYEARPIYRYFDD